MFIAQDLCKDTTRFGFYNCSYNFIPEKTWLMIKEPLYKRGNDGFNIIRVDDPNDIEFIENEYLD